MEGSSVAWKVTAVISVTLACLGAPHLGPAWRVDAKPDQPEKSILQAAQAGVAGACTPGKSLSFEGSGKVFDFKCAAGATLLPPEAKGKQTSPSPLQKVYQFNPNKTRLEGANPVCENETTLESLVPGSVLLNVTEAGSDHHLRSSEPSFKLTVGEAQEENKHLCYICSGPVRGDVKRQQQEQSNCTVYVTVPKTAPVPSPPSQDEHPDSGSFSPSMIGWLGLSVTGSALALALQL
ncbi:hypothetical protein CSUI_006179 [Cystoisospora suis]|uniref:SRS domain-containing protein n=1 Tax=Cystoisospora suis TaxID=483139 RepID=A0A2C6KSN7_9APIC|nr:hypothetical protein CSUI_006179 [Cystoisospora suis]